MSAGRKEPTTLPTLPGADEPKTLPNRPDSDEGMPSDRRPTLLFDDGSEKDTADQGKAAKAALGIVAAQPLPRKQTAADLSELLATTLGPRDEAPTAADLSDLLAAPPRSPVPAATSPSPAPPAPRRVHTSFVLAAVAVLALIAAMITAWVRW